MPVKYLSLFLASTLLSSCVALPFEKDIEDKFSSYKDKFDKKVQMPSWNANGFGYQMGVGKVPEPAVNPASSSPGGAEPPAQAPHPESAPVAPAPAPHPESAPVPPAPAPQPPATIPAPESPAPPSAHAPQASGTQAQANSGTDVGIIGESAASGGTSARKLKSQERGLGAQRLPNWG